MFCISLKRIENEGVRWRQIWGGASNLGVTGAAQGILRGSGPSGDTPPRGNDALVEPSESSNSTVTDEAQGNGGRGDETEEEALA